MLRPFFNYYGGKWRSASRYPRPSYGTIVEPFAGSAGYSVRHHDHDVTLVDRDEVVCSVWDYLIRVEPREILSLPDLGPEQTIDNLRCLCPEARYLIGFWLKKAPLRPNAKLTSWAKRWQEEHPSRAVHWGLNVKKRLARQVPMIRHWRIVCGDYGEAPDAEATWFVDPPYIRTGRHYKHGPNGIDYEKLADWCRSRRGQVVVCEQDGADWLPFRGIGEIRSLSGTSSEVVWTKDREDLAVDCF